MKEIIDMSRDELCEIKVQDITRLLTIQEVMHISKTLGAFWSYDYKKVRAKKIGMHALLKSGLHSDGYFDSKILLEPRNILEIMANQITMRLQEVGVRSMDWIAGVPNGATTLGKEVAKILGARVAKAIKTNGRIVLKVPVPARESVLVIDDFCTCGTGFIETVSEIYKKCPKAIIIPFAPVILNRGGMQELTTSHRIFKILAVAEKKIENWTWNDCILCTLGSRPIKPKENPENWQALITSQD